ncbi:MAG: 3-isopropylmalate dehydratase small subunit [Candidatus Nanopelagicaceae bacterium]|nr:3-isopropylmalate dehydratase small subunit [Candidatus Nanopelagicaceae bacterium]
MNKFITHTGIAVPMRISNIDTDQIISSAYLKRVTRTGFEDGLFEVWRKDPQFVLNNPEYAGASVLIAGANFGIGSSREHAVWALMDYGFKVVISSRFADIFRGNSSKAGLLCIQVDEEVIEELWTTVEADSTTRLSVDLEAREIRCGSLIVPFQIDDYIRWRFLEGLDDIEITLSHAADIVAYASTRPAWMPSIQ